MTKKFIRKDITKKKRIANTGWRKPKGITNKKRLNRKGHSPNVRTGYGTSNKEKNTKQGLQIILVKNIQELEQLNPKTQCAVLGKTGKQKKLDMIKKAEEKKITIINFKIDKFKEETQKFFTERQKATKETEQKKKTEIKKEENIKEKAQKEEKPEQELSEEEKQKLEKKEKDKILTKR